MRKAINLLELIISIVLLALIIAGVTSFEIGNRGMLNYSEDRSQLINEANLVLDRIVKDGAIAIGDTDNPPFANSDANNLHIMQDSNHDGMLDAGDQVVVYTFNAGAHTVTRTFMGAVDTLTSRASGFLLTPDGGVPPTSYIVRITLRYNLAAGAPARGIGNPEVAVQTRVVSSAYSIH